MAIALYDLRTHRIPNGFLIALLMWLLLTKTFTFSFSYFVMTGLAIALFTVITRCGFGDTKLSLIILNFIISREDLANYLSLLMLMAIAHVSLHLLCYRRLSGSIPFAPALCGAVLALQMGGLT